jgi:hypothetical protein
VAKFQPWTNPDPQTITGLNSQMVYGENIQFATGLNHQIALGSNLQLCVNPAAMVDGFGIPGSAAFAGLFGSGLGGNLQLCIGTNTNVTWGRQFTIAMSAAADNVTIDGTKHRPLSFTMLAILAAACVVYPIAFGETSDEDNRAGVVIGFQTLVDILLATLVVGGMFLQDADHAFTGELRKMFDTPDRASTKDWWALPGSIAFFGLLAAAILPSVAIAQEEGHFTQEQASS